MYIVMYIVDIVNVLFRNLTMVIINLRCILSHLLIIINCRSYIKQKNYYSKNCRVPQVVHDRSLKSSSMSHVFVNCDFVFPTRRKVRSVVRVPAYKPLGHDYLKNTRFYFKWLASCVFCQFLNALIPRFRLKHRKSRTQRHGYTLKTDFADE